ncbi:MAG: release factor glutamine methyltransferase [Janthinobacterium sp.]|jgi:release factor glutamine methyltransferase
MTPCAIAAGSTLSALQIGPLLGPLENRMLLCHVLGLTRVQLITQSERVLSRDEAAQLSNLIERRCNGEPMAYLIGQREFYGLAFHVNPAVLIPRPDTELLVDLALARLPQQGSVLDMGTGSGAIAVALAHARPDAQVTALDVSSAALMVARGNAALHDVAVTFVESDWYGALRQPEQRFDIIVANPPYIASGDSHLSQGGLPFEPLGALTDHADGLSALHRIAQDAARHLVPCGWLLMEHGYDQADAVRALLAAQGFSEVQSWNDLAGIERVSGGRSA